MKNEETQIDLFEGLLQFTRKLFPKKKTVSSDFSEKSLISFRYHARLNKAIRYESRGIFGSPTVILPAYMQSEEFAPVREIAAEWAEIVQKRRTKQNKQKIKELTERLWTATNQILSDRGQGTLISKTRMQPIVPKGKTHDLEQILAAVNETYFNGELEARITWSNRTGGTSFHSLRKDPYTGENVHLISISRGYDFENCPVYAIAGVVYHECLHIVIPVEIKNGRRQVHGRNFRQCEKRYIYYDEWMKWHRHVLPGNVRKLLKTKK
ncbi:MAG: SprT-like domain-containing protein [Fibrobacter sp.]|jgi:hypothetical protein|nr:SprT-like domain-containing protein [Fibrobacter sp.]